MNRESRTKKIVKKLNKISELYVRILEVHIRFVATDTDFRQQLQEKLLLKLGSTIGAERIQGVSRITSTFRFNGQLQHVALHLLRHSHVYGESGLDQAAFKPKVRHSSHTERCAFKRGLLPCLVEE